MTPAEFIDNPAWADFLPESRDAPRVRALPAHEDCAPLDVERAAMHLRRGGTLGSMPGYEERQGQIDMLRAIASAFNAREHLMIEAGTGVGKSLAYLIPAILWSRANDTPVVVSTATRNLQSQLLDHDIPRALGVLGEDEGGRAFRVALLKGRANYLCVRAVSEFFAAGYWTMSGEEQREMPRFIDWLKTTRDGDLDGYDGLPRALLTCPGEECPGRRCPDYARCFVYRARKRAAEADLVVVNHSLVLAEAASGASALLPAYGRLILDEAHNLEDIATEQLSREFSQPALMRILNRLSRRARGRRVAAGGILANVDRQLKKGAIPGAAAERISRLLSDAPHAMVGIVDAADELAGVAEAMLSPARKRGICRYRTAADDSGALRRLYSLDGLFQPYGEDVWDERALKSAQDRLEAALAAMVHLLHALRDELDSCGDPDRPPPFGDLSIQLSGAAESIVEFANDADFVLQGAKDGYAYWIERVTRERRRSHVRLVAAPLSVADDLARMLYDAKDSVVLSSATLRVGNDFRYMMKRLGCRERFRALTAPSPFDYLRQSLVLAPDSLPDPSADPSGYAKDLAALAADLFSATRGRALVLFTSYEMMNEVALFARDALAAAGIRLLVQGEGLSRESMTAALKGRAALPPEGDAGAPGAEAGAPGDGTAPGPTVLFGAQSFWEGVDVAGEALSCVVIARLPFAQRGDPVVEARGEKVAREGGSPFRDYHLPEAVIKFRQGFGRLIRTRSDRGVVIVTDPRIVTKNYGSSFRRSIPASVHAVSDRAELLARVKDFFDL